MLDECKLHNRNRRVKGDRTSPDEIAVLKVLCACSEQAVTFLEGIWGSDSVERTCIPMSLMASKFLDRAQELPIQKATNPFWYSVLQPTPAKYGTFFKRIHGSHVDGKKDSRDQRIIVWRMACLVAHEETQER